MTLARTAVRLAAMLAGGDILYLADDDQQAGAIHASLAALMPDHPVIHFPASDALPGDVAPATPANVGARVTALRRLRSLQVQSDRPSLALVISGEAAARSYPPPEQFDPAPPRLLPGSVLAIDELVPMLADIGYFPDDRVDEPGELAARGDVIDIFPADAGLPARIEFAGGLIAAIRCYDPASQRSVGDLDSLEIGRATEPAVTRPVSILAHTAPGSILFSAKAETRRRRFIQLAADAARGRPDRIEAIDDAAWQSDLAAWRQSESDGAFILVPRFAERPAPLAALARFAKPFIADGRVLVLAGSERDLRFLRPRVERRLGLHFFPLVGWDDVDVLEAGQAGTIEMPADTGFVDERIVLVAAADLLGSRAIVNDAAPVAGPGALFAAGDIRIGDVVIHEDHGVGIVAGLESKSDDLAPEGSSTNPGGEMIVLEYAGGARRLVETEQADLIWRYGADAGAVALDKLDGSSWQKRRGLIDEAIAQSARELAELAEARRLLVAPVLDPDAAAYERFAGGFAFNETADQARAIAAVRNDLASGKPMDRLVIGDVGYGKTEVALRAVALAALAGYQTIVAAPTTVLVRQHLETFQRRFAGTGITVASLSRLSTAAQKKAVKKGLADGSIGVLIGTGAVMAKGVTYARLGLVVIDEEQRFGAADKVRLRGSGEVHLLTLSATPIPRTLQMALIGLQQISLIATPPARRQPIRTSLDRFDDARVRTALMREKGRGGQSFVVVPRIEDMAGLAARLHRIVPDLLVIEAHGKMPAAEIDRAMVSFASGNGDVLLATNIIEAGLDVPRANTMIVWRADRFGLAQLHQLRGRVGRGNRRGQVILLTETEDAIGERTLKRLRALATYDQLGAGFDISARDLDLRGAGDLLGENQAGHIKLIGIDLYQHLLGSALRAERGEEVEHWSPELKVGLGGRLPDDWIPEPGVRLSLYARLARIANEAELDAFEDEMTDRFGPLPPAARAMMAKARMRAAARQAKIARIDAGPAAIALTPRWDFDNKTVGAGKSLNLIEKNGRLLLAERVPEGDRFERVLQLLEALAD